MDWILYLAAIFLVMFSQIKVQGAYTRYRQVMTLRGYTGAQVARRILDDHGLQEVRIEPAQGGALSDHYDPKANVVRLSQDIYANSSIASVAVAAHECVMRFSMLKITALSRCAIQFCRLRWFPVSFPGWS